MRRSRLFRGGRTALLLATLSLLLAGCSAGDWEKKLRFGWPTGVTKQATRMRVLWSWTGLAALVLGVIVWGLIFWACIRYRKKSDELPRQTKYNFFVEAICFTFPFLVIGVLFYRTVVVEDYVNRLSKNPDVRVQVDAFKWNWQFEYISYAKGGAQATVYPGVKNPADTSQLLHLSTVGSQNEIPILVIPVNQTVQFDEHSYDVLHSFWVPEFLFKRDVIPFGTTATDRDNKFEITATSTGSFVGRCAELCGTYHSQMNFEVRVVTDKTFAAYLKALQSISSDDPARQAKALAQAGLRPYATTTYPLDSVRTTRKASQRSN